MDKVLPLTSEMLRKQFQSIPAGIRETNQNFSIRIWRGLSWLERAEQAEDFDDKFIALWISFNAVYGRQDGAANPERRVGEHATWQAFLARLVKLDTGDLLGEIVRRNQMPVLRLIQNKYLFRPFWERNPRADAILKKNCTAAILNFANHLTTAIMEELFERLYVLRAQVFHGAATRGSKLNRSNLRMGAELLSRILPAMIAIMLSAGTETNWGEVCFPPIKD